MQSPHKSVLLNEVLEIFKDVENGVFVDCTLGFAGHSEAILKQNPNINLIGFDKDDNALEFSKKKLEPFGDRVRLIKGGFSSNILKIKDESIKAVLADIGVSSWQLDEKSRGFGFESDTLDMRMDQEQNFSALDVVNSYAIEELERILRDYGELARWRQIANDIVKARKIESIKTPQKLHEIIGNKRERSRKISEATLVFQAIRVEVNDELGELMRLLDNLQNLKPSDTKIGIITFHSLEDRIVKNYFKKWAKKCVCSDEALRCECGNDNHLGEILTKKPIVPSCDEIKQNPRSRSSKLRVFKFRK